MNPAMQQVIERLRALPEGAQCEIAVRLHKYLDRVDELRAGRGDEPGAEPLPPFA